MTLPPKRFIDSETTFTGKFSSNVFATIGESFRPFYIRMIALIIVGVAGRTALLVSTNVIGVWADAMCAALPSCAVPSGASSSWFHRLFSGWNNADFLHSLEILAVIGFIGSAVFRIGLSRTGARAASILYDEVTLRTSRVPMTFFDATPVGRIISRFGSDYSAIFRMAGGPLSEFACLVFDLLIMMVLIIGASAWFIPLVVMVGVLNYFAYKMNLNLLRRERRAMAQLRGPTIAHFAETVQGALPIKVFAKEDSFFSRFSSLLSTMLKQRLRTVLAMNFFSLQMTSVTALVLLVTGLGGIYGVAAGKVSVGSLGVAFTFVALTSTTIQQFFEWLANIEEALTGIERLDHYLRMPLEAGAKLPPQARFMTAHPQQSSTEAAALFANLSLSMKSPGTYSSEPDVPDPKNIDVQGLWLRYRDDLPWVLKDVSFTLKAGEHVGIIGKTGSGKSSLIQTLFYLYPFQRGSIAVGGFVPDLLGPAATLENHQTQKIPLQEFRRMLALIPQDPQLFRATLRENLVHTAYTDEQIIDVLSWVGLTSLLPSFTQAEGAKLDTFIEERGQNLSTGERQLVCMARAILQRSPIMIMDEATSSIDPDTENILMETFRHRLKNRTRLVVAHRLSTVKDCDRVLWLDHGQVRMLDEPKYVIAEFLKSNHH